MGPTYKYLNSKVEQRFKFQVKFTVLRFFLLYEATLYLSKFFECSSTQLSHSVTQKLLCKNWKNPNDALLAGS